MEKEESNDLPEALCTDEAVCFIADRYHVTPQQLLRYFLYGETSIPLEANEVEILKGLSGQVLEDIKKAIGFNETGIYTE